MLNHEKIIAAVCREYGVSEREVLVSRVRNADVVAARHMAAFIVEYLTEFTSSEVAWMFSFRDHSMLTYIRGKVLDRHETDRRYRETFNKVCRSLGLSSEYIVEFIRIRMRERGRRASGSKNMRRVA